MINRKRIAIVFCTMLLLNIAQPALAQASENSGKTQSPFQVLVTIVLCTIVMKVLERFKIP